MSSLTDKQLKELIGRTMIVEYLYWGNLKKVKGTLNSFAKGSIVVSGVRINRKSMDISLVEDEADGEGE